MTSMPPEPSPWPASQPSPWPASSPPPLWPAGQPPPNPPPAYAPPPRSGLHRRRRMSVARIVCGVLWGAVALICAAGAVGEWLIGIPGGAILCLVIAVGSGWYDYRVWTSRSRRLIV